MSTFEAFGLCCGYGKKEVIRGVSFKVDGGTVAGVIGANGSGKTTLIKAIASILPHKGECRLDGEVLEKMTVSHLSRVCSYIPQRSGISIDISALDVVVMGLNPHLGIFERPSADMIKRAEEALELVGFTNRASINYMKLSEGQKSLCIMARSLVSTPRLFLMDEPEGALDFSVRHKALSIVKARVRKDGACALVSLHDPSLALGYCDKLLLIGDGVIVDEVFPQTDPVERVEEGLRKIYGDISIVKVAAKDGKERLIMIKE